MFYYKTPDNRTHALDSKEFEYLLPEGYTEITEAVALAIVNPPPTPEQLQAEGAVKIQAKLDELAQQRGYDSIASACGYAAPAPVVPEDDPNFAQCEKFRLEGNALQAYRARVWAQCYAYLATVAAGQNPMPTPSEGVAMMPSFTWPD